MSPSVTAPTTFPSASCAKKNPEHIGVETPKCFLYGLGLGDDDEGAFQHVLVPKAAGNLGSVRGHFTG